MIFITDASRDPFILFLKSYFAEHPEYVWSEDPTNRKILIADAYALSVEDIEKLPSIIVMRGPLTLENPSMAYGSIEWDVLKNFEDKHMIRMCRGSLRVHTVAHDGIIAERLANEVMYAVEAFKDLLRKVGYHSINPVNISPEQPLELAGTTIDKASVTVDFSISFMIKIDVMVPEELKKKVTKAVLETIETWYAQGPNVIKMEVS